MYESQRLENLGYVPAFTDIVKNIDLFFVKGKDLQTDRYACKRHIVEGRSVCKVSEVVDKAKDYVRPW